MKAYEQIKPRSGFKGILDRFVGPGATPAELLLQFLLPVVAAIITVIYASNTVANWSLWHYIVCALLAFDVMGGIITNATSAGKRWYHRPGQNWPQHLGFVMLHIAHLVLVSWLFLNFNITWLVIAALYLILASIVIISTRPYLQQPVALAMYAISLVVCLYVLKMPVGLEWFLPLFYLKLLVSHLPAK